MREAEQAGPCGHAGGRLDWTMREADQTMCHESESPYCRFMHLQKKNLSKHLKIKYGEHLGHLHTSLHIWLAT